MPLRRAGRWARRWHKENGIAAAAAVPYLPQWASSAQLFDTPERDCCRRRGSHFPEKVL